MKTINTSFSEQIQSENCRKSGKIITLNTYMYYHSLSWLGIGTSLKSAGVKVVLSPTSLLLHTAVMNGES